MILSNIISCFIQPDDNNNVLDNIYYADLLDDLDLCELDVDRLSDDDVLLVSAVVLSVSVILIPCSQLARCPDKTSFNR